ncbi:hypothetical protein [Methylocystis heyeri]|uniref:Roadblock/LC7 domain-containing protein n=1 Tax=Methylocystis heyeri TaxID=391905 RepID=A0A6B8KDK2_9HYPH|nr:hypothetical protein [Methylocystis heyeri]QGM45757.1 hypothetical protein H2LOC_008605 [Methylocystis heyeri]
MAGKPLPAPRKDEGETPPTAAESAAEPDPISRDLAIFKIGHGERRDLTQLLDRVCSAGRFESALLSSEEGFSLAASSGAGDTDDLAASLARLAFAIDQAANKEGQAPTAFLIRDARDDLMLCRMFQLRGQRLFFTTRSRNSRTTSWDLDTVVPKIEEALEPGPAPDT